MTDTDELVLDRRGHVLVARINRPDARNALNPAVMLGLGAAVLSAENDPDIRVLVITGTGDRAFSAGLDLRAFHGSEFADSASKPEMKAFQRLLKHDVRVPLVGAANASALAGGFELLLSCDIIVVADSAKLGLPEVKRGLFAAGGGMTLGTRVPLSIALELTLTGDSIDAARGASIGLVNAVVPADQVLDTALGYAERIAENAPLAVAASKELIRLTVTDAAAADERFGETYAKVFGSQDAKEGGLAFFEKRAPVWQSC